MRRRLGLIAAVCTALMLPQSVSAAPGDEAALVLAVLSLQGKQFNWGVVYTVTRDFASSPTTTRLLTQLLRCDRRSLECTLVGHGTRLLAAGESVTIQGNHATRLALRLLDRPLVLALSRVPSKPRRHHDYVIVGNGRSMQVIVNADLSQSAGSGTWQGHKGRCATGGMVVTGSAGVSDADLAEDPVEPSPTALNDLRTASCLS